MSTTQAQRPAGVAAAELRAAIGHFATGVTVVTAVDAEQRDFGSTANAISSVSLQPPLVLVCLRDESETLAAILATRRFAVNVLRDDQRQLAERFARSASRDTWAGVPHHPAPTTGAALIDGALATLESDLHDVADGGDHTIVIARVLAVEHPAEHVVPLLFYRGAFAVPPLPPESSPPGEPRPPEQSSLAEEPPPATEVVRVSLPTAFGDLRLLAVDPDGAPSTSVIALVGEPEGSEGTHVYVHEGCLLGDTLGHTRCGGRARLHAALERMRELGSGVVIYRRDDSAPFGGCCLGGGSARPPAEQSVEAVRLALDDLRLRRVRLLVGPGDQRPERALGLDVAEVARLGGES